MNIGEPIIQKRKGEPQREEFCAEVEPGRWLCIQASVVQAGPRTELLVATGSEHKERA